MTDEEKTAEELIDEILPRLMKLGNDLPQFLARLDLPNRGAAVALLHEKLHLSPEVVGHLIAHPESVEMHVIGAMDFALPDLLHDVVMDQAVYAVAERLEKHGFDVGKALGIVGLDWPPGSDDYHGGSPLAKDASRQEKRDREQALSDLLDAWSRAAKENDTNEESR